MSKGMCKSCKSLLRSCNDLQFKSDIIDLSLEWSALKDEPTFDLNASLENLQLHQLNEFLKAYANFDINIGTPGLYTEIAAKEGRFAGYVKPMLGKGINLEKVIKAYNIH